MNEPKGADEAETAHIFLSRLSPELRRIVDTAETMQRNEAAARVAEAEAQRDELLHHLRDILNGPGGLEVIKAARRSVEKYERPFPQAECLGFLPRDYFDAYSVFRDYRTCLSEIVCWVKPECVIGVDGDQKAPGMARKPLLYAMALKEWGSGEGKDPGGYSGWEEPTP